MVICSSTKIIKIYAPIQKIEKPNNLKLFRSKKQEALEGIAKSQLRLDEFEYTKGVIRVCKSKKDRQHNDQRKKDKRTDTDLQNIHIKLKIV